MKQGKNIQPNALYAKLFNNVNDFNNNEECMDMDIPFQKCISLFDKANTDIFQQKLNGEEIPGDLLSNTEKTQKEKREYYTNEVIGLINSLKKSDKYQELPQLPFGKQLSDTQFINLLKACISYANYKLESSNIDNIKMRLTNEYYPALKNLFQRGQIVKDIIENALITILTTDIQKEQEDNFNLLKVEKSTATPIICMKFTDKDEDNLDMKEFQDIFCSHVYLEYYKKALREFIQKVPSKKKLKEYICNYFRKHYIYFCELPANILAFTFHSGNIYLKGTYLYDYYNYNSVENRLLTREKIILNIGHELMHVLMREINENMKNNFLIKSNSINKSKDNSIQFNDKFTSEVHLFDKDESGDIFDFKFFNKFYFDDLYPKEANFFHDIKTITSLKTYKEKLNAIIQEEKKEKLIPLQANKFKKLNNDPPRRCIRSRILGVQRAVKKDYIEISSDSDESENLDDSN